MRGRSQPGAVSPRRTDRRQCARSVVGQVCHVGLALRRVGLVGRVGELAPGPAGPGWPLVVSQVSDSTACSRARSAARRWWRSGHRKARDLTSAMAAWPGHLIELPARRTRRGRINRSRAVSVSVNGAGLGDEVAGPLRGDAAAERMGLIAMKTSGPAGGATGVAYLRAMPFAAGQALAAGRRPPAIGRDSCIVFTGAQPQANSGRAWPPMRCVSCAAVIRRRGS